MSRPIETAADYTRALLTTVGCGALAGFVGAVAYKFFNDSLIYGAWGIAATIVVVLIVGGVGDWWRGRADRRAEHARTSRDIYR